MKEAGFNNSFKENEENHKEEVEILITKVEDAKAEVTELHGQMSKLKSDHDAKIGIRNYSLYLLMTCAPNRIFLGDGILEWRGH